MALKAGRPTGRTKQHIEKVKTILLDDEENKPHTKESTDDYSELQFKVEAIVVDSEENKLSVKELTDGYSELQFKVEAIVLDSEENKLSVKELTDAYSELQRKVKTLEDENVAINSELEALNLKLCEREKSTSKACSSIWWWNWF